MPPISLVREGPIRGAWRGQLVVSYVFDLKRRPLLLRALFAAAALLAPSDGRRLGRFVCRVHRVLVKFPYSRFLLR